MVLPRVLIISTVCGKAAEIAKKIGGKSVPSQDNLEYYLWHINNKYYMSQVLLCPIENPNINLSIEGVEGLIIYHDPQADNADQNLDQWSSVISSLSKADVLMLVCNLITNADVKEKVIAWCINKKFELVELQQLDSSESLECDSEHNTYGIERIIEALHAHMWPNMVLKGKSSSEDTDLDVNQVEKQLENIQLTRNASEHLRMESVLDGLMGGENADFGELFGQLIAMKAHACSLPTNERRAAAKQVVAAFWKAMGGEPSEIDD